MFPVSYWSALPKVLCQASLHQQTRFTPANREAVETGSTLRQIQWKPDLNQNENRIKQTKQSVRQHHLPAACKYQTGSDVNLGT